MNENNWKLERIEIYQQIELLKSEIEKIKNNTIPIGSIQAFAMAEAPDGWLICDGEELLIEPYQELFDVIGYTFGGDGVTSFCVPDLRGQFIRGWDMDGDIDPERELGDFQDDALQGHGHKINKKAIELTCSKTGHHNHHMGSICKEIREASFARSTYYECFVGDYGAAKAGTRSSSYNDDHKHDIILNFNDSFIQEPQTDKYGQTKCDTETRPKNIALLYCIKY